MKVVLLLFITTVLVGGSTTAAVEVSSGSPQSIETEKTSVVPENEKTTDDHKSSKASQAIVSQNGDDERSLPQGHNGHKKSTSSIRTLEEDSGDPCLSGNHVCGAKADCVSVPDSSRGYTCVCKAGYVDNSTNGRLDCVDIDECQTLEQPCHEHATCVNAFPPELYSCTCLDGFTGDGFIQCDDINECALGTDNCAAGNATCVNGIGNFSCSCSEQDELFWNGTTCEETPTITEAPSPTVTLPTRVSPCDPDPCESVQNSECVDDQFGNVECRCKSGYMRFSGAAGACTNIDECANGLHDCDPNAICADTPGSYYCICRTGYHTGSNRVCLKENTDAPTVAESSSPSAPPTPRPAGAPRPPSPAPVSPQPTTIPISTEEFISQTQIEPSLEDELTSQVQQNDAGESFLVSATLKSVETTIVSLAAVEASVAEVVCSEDSSLHINFGGSVDINESSELFPLNSILVINSEVFGGCRLAPEVTPENVTFSSNTVALDGYLLIDTVEVVSSTTIKVSGRTANFFTIFPEGNIQIERVNDAGGGRKLVGTEVTFDISDTYNGIPLLELKAAVQVKVAASIDVLSAQWSLSGLDIQIQLGAELTTSSQLDVNLKAGTSAPIRRVSDSPSIPIAGLPSVFKQLGKLLGYKLPDLVAGLYFEMPLVAELGGSIEATLFTTFMAEYKSGRKDFLLFARGPWLSLDIGVETVTNEPVALQANLVSVPALDDEAAQFSTSGFVGVAPSIVVYGILFNSVLSVDVGANLQATGSIPNPFKPLTQAERDATFHNDVCESCHFVRLDVDARLKRLLWSGTVGIYVSIETWFFTIEETYEFTFEQELPGNVNIQFDVGTICLFYEFGEEFTEVCSMGEICCNTEIEQTCMEDTSMSPPIDTCEGMPSVMPSPMPTTLAPVTPAPVPTPMPDEGDTGSANGDPHIYTFDSLSYDCQGTGEFILTRSLDSDFQVQTRFGGNTAGQFGDFTITKGAAIFMDSATPLLQVSVAFNTESDFTLIGTCPILFIEDGQAKELVNGLSGPNYSLSLEGTRRIVITYATTGIIVRIRLWRSGSFGCGTTTNVFIPRSYSENNRIVGLLGSPNQDPFDDWMAADGTVLSPPSSFSDRYQQPAYDYCTENWCIRDSTLSLFQYEQGFSFDDFDECDAEYGADIDLSQASPDLSALCGTDVACLIDGINGDLDDARVALEDLADLQTERLASSTFSFEPGLIQVNEPTSIFVTITVSSGTDLPGSFRVYPISEDGIQSTTAVLTLLDDGSALSSDIEAGDGIFSNELALLSATAGEVFGFRAIPVINGVEDASSSLVRTELSAVRSFSQQSGLGSTGGSTGGSIFVASLEGLVLRIEYSWPTTVRDLDTNTEFLGGSVGFACPGGSPYLFFTSGDNTSSGGTELVTVLLDASRDDGLWSDSVTVELFAGWFSSSGGSGPALVRTALLDSSTEAELPFTGLSLVIEPGQQSSCASTPVGNVRVVQGGGGFSITLGPVSS